MKINQTYVATVIIGIIVGALIVGIIDANRSEPLFAGSSQSQAPVVKPPTTSNTSSTTKKTLPEPKTAPKTPATNTK